MTGGRLFYTTGISVLLIPIVIMAVASCITLEDLSPPTQVSVTQTVSNSETPTVGPTEVPTQVSAIIEPTATKDARKTCRVATGQEFGQVNIRTGPGVEYPAIGTLSENELTWMDGLVKNGWAKVTRSNNQEGWVNLYYCIEGAD